MTFHQIFKIYLATRIPYRQFIFQISNVMNSNFVRHDIKDKLLVYDKIIRIKYMIN